MSCAVPKRSIPTVIRDGAAAGFARPLTTSREVRDGILKKITGVPGERDSPAGAVKLTSMRAGILDSMASFNSPVIRLNDATFRRGDTEILAGINLEIQAGERWALLGPNGAGKTTILGFCGAQMHPSSGTVEVLGHTLGRVDMQTLRRQIGHVNPRHPLRSTMPVLDLVLTGITATIERPNRWKPTGDELAQANQLIDEMGLAARRNARWPILSQGERGRALIARALIARPKLLLLDEPTTGLDVAAREQFLETLDELRERQPELTTVLVTHHLEELPATTTHAVLVSHGKITAQGRIGEVLTTDKISAAFEHPIEVLSDAGRWVARSRPVVRT